MPKLSVYIPSFEGEETPLTFSLILSIRWTGLNLHHMFVPPMNHHRHGQQTSPKQLEATTMSPRCCIRFPTRWFHIQWYHMDLAGWWIPVHQPPRLHSSPHCKCCKCFGFLNHFDILLMTLLLTLARQPTAFAKSMMHPPPHLGWSILPIGRVGGGGTRSPCLSRNSSKVTPAVGQCTSWSLGGFLTHSRWPGSKFWSTGWRVSKKYWHPLWWCRSVVLSNEDGSRSWDQPKIRKRR